MKTTEPTLNRLRNIGIVAHVDAGKTTLTERVLFYAGAIHRMGDVDDGNTATDFDPTEQKKGITITAAAISCLWQQKADPDLWRSAPGVPHPISIIDTPGHVDFTAEVERTMRVLDGVIAVFSAVDGVQPESERVWRKAEHYGVPRLAFINKMDRLGADFDAAAQDLRDKLKANPAVVLMPLGAEDDFRGQIDVLNQRALLFGEADGSAVTTVPLEGDDLARAQAARRALTEQLAELDDVIAEAWLADRMPTAEELSHALRRQTLANAIVPVVAGSAFKKIGVQPLLDAVVDYLPSPLDVRPGEGHHPKTDEPIALSPDSEAPLCALAFKVTTDEHGRRRVFVRVYQGRLEAGSSVLNASTGETVRVSRLVKIQADRDVPLDRANAGEIAAIVGLKTVTTGQTLCAPEAPVLLEPPSFPVPVISMAIEPKTRDDQERMGYALQQLADEDPTFRVTIQPETGQTLIAGMGELHLEVLRERMVNRHRVATNAGEPEIAYRETATKPARGEGKHIHQHGGNGMHGHVVIDLRPGEPGSGLVIRDRVVGGSIPQHFLGSTRKGIEDAAGNGGLAGYPVVDVEVDIIDGSTHVKDSNDQAFRIAGSLALQGAVANAAPVLLEPIMKLECTTPPEHQGDLVGDLTRRRGQVQNLRARGSATVIEAEVPLAEMFGYATAIRSLSKGRAEFSMAPSRFAPVPEALAQEVIRKR